MTIKKDPFKRIIWGLLIVGFILMYWQIDGAHRLQVFALENSPLSAEEVLHTFQMNSTEACKENKYELPLNECVSIINKRGSTCTSQASEKFPGKINTIEKMLLVGNFYTACVFKETEESKL